jgi:hypothetical protein
MHLLVGNRIGSVCQTGPDIRLRQSRIRVQQICHRRSLGKLAQYQFNRNPGIPNHGLAEHHRWIDLDSFRHEFPFKAIVSGSHNRIGTIYLMLPPEFEQDAFRADNGEFGWPRKQIPVVVDVLRHRRLLLGDET